MFDALKGFKEALAAKERQPEPRRELAQDAIEELNRILCIVHPGDTVTAIYFCRRREEYCQLSGNVLKVDHLYRMLHIGTECIEYKDLKELIPQEYNSPSCNLR